jgi:hypothetical protein
MVVFTKVIRVNSASVWPGAGRNNDRAGEPIEHQIAVGHGVSYRCGSMLPTGVADFNCSILFKSAGSPSALHAIRYTVALSSCVYRLLP